MDPEHLTIDYFFYVVRRSAGDIPAPGIRVSKRHRIQEQSLEARLEGGAQKEIVLELGVIAESVPNPTLRK